MERLTALIEQYQEKSPPPTFGFVAPITACFDEFEPLTRNDATSSGLIAPINMALRHVYAEGDVQLITDYGFWLWLETATRKGALKRTDKNLLCSVFGSTPVSCAEPLFATLIDRNREFKPWRQRPTVPIDVRESVSDPTQRPVLSVHARHGEISHMERIVCGLIKRCEDRWSGDFKLWASSDSNARCA